MSSPKSSRANVRSTCFRSVKDTFLSIYSPSIWWKKQCALAVIASLRYTLPGHIMRIGGCDVSITLACTELVWLLKSMFFVTSAFPFSTKKVSCISLAGWSAAKFIFVNTCKSSSTSGPSASVKPIRENMSIISFLTIVNGCLEPSFIGYGVLVRSRAVSSSAVIWHCSFSWFMRSVVVCFSWLIFMPTSRFCSAGTFLKSFISALISPFLLRYFSRRASISLASLALSVVTSCRSCSIFWSIIFVCF